MEKIKGIEYNNEYIELETSDKYIYKIPNNNSYVRNLLYNGIKNNKQLDKDIKYYDKCADICIYPIWVSVGFLVYSIVTNFILLDMILIGCGALTGLSLLGTTVFKLVNRNLKIKANNNEYFIKLYEYAKSGGKSKDDKKMSIQKNNQNVKSNQYAKSGKQIIQDEPIRKRQSTQTSSIELSENIYHLNKNQIIQDEEVHQRKR